MTKKSGDAVLIGTPGNDKLVGGSGNDLLNGRAGNDRLAGKSGNDDLIGGAGNDTLIGGAGNDVLDGGTGADTMRGGEGNDTYFVDNAGDIVIEKSGEGTDTVDSAITYVLGANVENLTLIGSGAINGTGNSQNNTIIGNGADNLLNGAAGADTMMGGAGNDTYVVDNIGDVVTELANQGTDTVLSSISYTLGANVEMLTLTGVANVNGSGNSQDNQITGTSGNNILDGGAGNDTLIGGAGSDTLIGGIGDDVYVIESAGDVVSELSGQGSDTVRAAGSNQTLTLGASNGGLTGIEAIDLADGGNKLNVAAADILARSDTATLRVDGGATSLITTTDADWIAGADAVIGGVTYHVFAKGGATLQIASGIDTDHVNVVVANHNATITGTATGDVTEDGTLTAAGVLVVVDPDQGQSHTQAGAGATARGSFAVDANGNWSYSADNAAIQIQSLGAGDTAVDSFVVTSQDGTATQTLNVTIHGVNDDAVITGDSSGDVLESSITGGTLSVADPDTGQSHSQSAAATSLNGLGHYAVDAAGNWTFAADTVAADSLAAGESATDSFVVSSVDGSAQQTVSITVTGVNDVALFTGAVVGGVTEDGTLTASGVLVVTDADAGQSHTAAATGAAAHGTYAVDTDGHWSYTADNDAIQYLGAGEIATDTFTVTSQDGSASQQVAVTIHGVNDAASIGPLPVAVGTAPLVPILSGPADHFSSSDATPLLDWLDSPGAVSYNGSYYEVAYSGTSNDVALGPVVNFTVTGSSFEIPTSLVEGNTYAWKVQAVDLAGHASDFSLPESFHIVGSGGDTIPPTVPGTPDLATGDDSGPSSSDNITSQTSGLTFSWGASADTGPGAVYGLNGYVYRLDLSTWSSVITGTSVDVGATEGYHTFQVRSVDEAGNLSASAALPFTVDTSASGTVAEDGTLIASGALVVTDADQGQSHTLATTGASALGTYAVDADGHWTYTADSDAIQYLGAGETAADTFAVTSQDGSASEQVSITIKGPGDPDDAFVYHRDSDSQLLVTRHGNTTALPSNVDAITGFVHGSDVFDLSQIDPAVLGFVGQTTSVVAHSVNWFVSGGHTVVQADTDGNAATVELEIDLAGTQTLTHGDFWL